VRPIRATEQKLKGTPTPPAAPATTSHAWHIAGFVGLLLLTALLRFPLLSTIPVGLHFDEAWSGLDAATVTWTHHPVFFTDSNGMEPLYLYMQTLSILLFGQTAFALRVVSAVIGTLTVPALFLLIRRLADRCLALFAAAILAVTYWHVHVSRLGYRAILLPPVECLVWWALWNGAAKRDWRWLAAGGALVGVALYTYSTARVFPLAVTVWFLWLALRQRSWRPLAQLVLVGAVALLVFAPLGWYFLQHPEEFLSRVAQVVVLSPGVSHSAQPAVLVGAERTLGMFSLHGDPQWKYNLSGKPIFDPLMSVFFYAGMLSCLLAAVRGRHPTRHADIAGAVLPADAAALLLIWFAVMIVPGFVTTDPPETLHTLATVPVVCTLPAIGAVWLWRLLQQRRPRWQGLAAPLAVTLVLAEAIATAVSYFVIWAPNPQTYYWLHGDVADLAAVLKQAPASATLYVSTQYYRHPTLRFLAPQAAQRAIWFEAEKSLPVRPTPGEALYAFANGYQPLPAARSALPLQDRASAPRDSAGGIAYQVYQLPQPAALPALATPLNVTLGGDVALLDASVTAPSAAAPRTVTVTLRWRVLRQPQRKLSLFVHLLDASGHRWAQSDGQGFFSDDWRTGDEVVTTETLQLPVGTPAVSLRVSADFYDVASGHPLSWSAPSGPPAAPDGGVVGGQVTALPSAPGEPVPGALPARDLAPGLRLVGALLPTSPVTAGATADVTLYLQRTAPGVAPSPPLRLTGAAAHDAEPIAAAPLLDALPVGDVLAVRHVVTISARTTATTALLQLPTAQGTLTLGQLRLVPLPRVYQAPAPQHALAVTFGTVAELVGSDVARRDSKTLTVTLYWKALQPSNVSYTVFNHLTGPVGAMVAQRDGLPADGKWPTTSWLPNQIITDRHQLVLPGNIALAQDVLQVGLYDSQAPGLPRLPASGEPGQAGDTYAVVKIGG
jgi:4-amino-4-deoxy-L-arabinose transferase-like glycosyltransferase